MDDIELIVIGGGIAGSAAALRAAQYHLPTVWVRGSKATHKASRGAYVYNIDNMIGVHPDIVRKKVVEALAKDFPEAAERIAGTHFHISTQDVIDNAAERVGADFADWVEVVDAKVVGLERGGDGRFVAETEDGGRLGARNVVLATGVMDRQPVVHKRKGERTLAGIHWLFPYANQETLLYCVRCEGHLTRGKRVALVGGGAATAEVALMIRQRYDAEVVLLTGGEPVTWGEGRTARLEAGGVEVFEGELVDVRGADKGSTLHGFTLADGREVDVDLAFISMGLFRVYNELARAVGAELEPGDAPAEQKHVLVDARGETSVPGLFAIGDMAARGGDEPMMKQVYTSQEYAVRAVDTVDRRRRAR